MAWEHLTLKNLSVLLTVLPWEMIAADFCAAQSIVPAIHGTGTIVTPDGNCIDISGGRLSTIEPPYFTVSVSLAYR